MITPLLLAAALTAAPPRDVVTAMFAAFNRHDTAAMQRLYAPDARLASPDFCRARTGRDVTRTYAALFAAMPDLRDEDIVTVAEGERVAVRFVARSRVQNLALPIQAMLRVRRGRIVEDDSLFVPPPRSVQALSARALAGGAGATRLGACLSAPNTASASPRPST